jgi:hypothetical protein
VTVAACGIFDWSPSTFVMIECIRDAGRPGLRLGGELHAPASRRLFHVDGHGADHATLIEYGRSLCDVLRRNGTNYDVISEVTLDRKLDTFHTQTPLDAAEENYRPALRG